MQTPEEMARQALGNIAGPLRSIFRGSEHAEWLDALDVLIGQETEHLADLIRARDAEVAEQARAEALAPFVREDVAPFHGYGHTVPGYWRLVGPRHYKPLPPPPTTAEVRALRERFGLEPEP